MEYSSSVWDPHTQRNVNKLEAVQRRAARAVLKDYSRTSSVTSMLQQLGWSTLQERRAKARVIFFYKVVNGLVAVPLEPYLSVNKRDTRGHGMKFYVPTTRTVVYQNSFFPATIRLWNNLPAAVVSSPNIDALRARLAPVQLV